ATCSSSSPTRRSSDLDDLLAPGQSQLHRAQIHVRERYRGTTQDEQPTRGVVGDGVDDVDVPVRDATVDDLQGGKSELHRPKDIRSEEHTSELQSRCDL